MTITQEVLDELKSKEFYDLQVMVTSPNMVLVVGKRFASLNIQYHPRNTLLTIELNSRAERVSNYIKNRYGVEYTPVRVTCPPDKIIDHCVDIDDFLKIFYGK